MYMYFHSENKILKNLYKKEGIHYVHMNFEKKGEGLSLSNCLYMLHIFRFFSPKCDNRLIFMPPLKKGVYCFATVGRSVDQVLSAQYLLTLSLDQYQTWCRGSPR